MEALQKLLTEVNERLKEVERLLAGIRLPTSWFFAFPAHFKKISWDEAFSPAVLATTATTGFLFLPTCAGAPTGVPARNGAVVYDTTNNQIYVYNGAWKKTVALT